jgi:hypothetical protein
VALAKPTPRHIRVQYDRYSSFPKNALWVEGAAPDELIDEVVGAFTSGSNVWQQACPLTTCKRNNVLNIAKKFAKP